MIIGVAGFGSSGSSAVTDYLKEFDSLSVVDGLEFVLPFTPDGIHDLDYHLNECVAKYLSSDVAITRFVNLMETYQKVYNHFTHGKFDMLYKNYVDGITQIKRRGYGGTDRIIFPGYVRNRFADSVMKKRVIKWLEKLLNHPVDIFPVRDIYYSVNPKDFLSKSKQFLIDFLVSAGADFTKPVVLNQPFPGNDPQTYFKYFDNPKAIVVDRDPRDMYLFAKLFLKNVGKQYPTDTVEHFVTYYRGMRDNMPYKNADSNVLLLHFEDMVYRYEETTKKINDFCALSPKDKVRSIFNPADSINNTQVFRRYKGYERDVAYIENQLSEYLFDYSDYKDLEISGAMFYGDALKKKR